MKTIHNRLGKAIALLLSCAIVLTFLPAFASAAGLTYTVTFDSQGGSAVSKETVAFNSTLTPPIPPTKDGYIFVGWYKDAACTIPWVFSSDKVTANITLYAGWIASIPTAPASVKAVSASYNSVKVSWNAVKYVSGYEVYRAASSSGSYSLAGSTTALSLTNSGLNTGSTYYFKVKAYIQVGTIKVYSDFSPAVSAKPVPSAPASFKASAANYNTIRVSWGAVAGATKYELYRATSKTGTYKLLTTTASLYVNNTGVNTGTAYYYKVRAYRLVGSAKVYGAYSAIVTCKTALAAPTGVKAARASATSVKVSWGAVAGVTKYEVWRSASSSGTYSLVAATTAKYYTNTHLTTGKTYYYKVRAYRLVGSAKVYGAFSPVVSAKP